MLQNLFVCIIILLCPYNVYSEILQSIRFTNGIARLKQRNLDTIPGASLPTASSPYYNSFAVKTSFGASYVQQQDIQSDSDFDMQIMISTSQSGLNALGSCDVFQNKSYICQSPLCTENTSSPKNVSYPFFSSMNATTLNITNSTISIANGAWQLKASSPLYVNNCNTSDDYFLAGYAYGWIGLGLSTGSNFQYENPVFSFLLSPNSTGESELIFGFNSSYASNLQPVAALNSDPDWKLSVSSLSFGPSFVSNYLTITPLIFDVQYHRIALPAAQYNAIMNYLQTFEYQGMTCDSTQQDCFFLGNLSVLPDLTFTLADGSTFSLPPSSYMIQYDDSNYYTMFDSFDTQFAQENYTIIGTNVMSHYYTVFSNPSPSNYTISLYSLASTSSSNNNSESNNGNNSNINDNSFPTSTIIIIIVGVIAVAGLIGLVCYLRHKNAKSKREENFVEKQSFDVELNQSDQANL